jgi:NDP-sugar pyrophosphorylase family protein
MKAMILTAGLGTRLRPLTLERAKPSIPLLGKPLVIRLLERLLSQDVSEFRLNLHHLPESIEKLFLSRQSGFSVSFSRESSILGTAGGLKANEAFFDEGTFLMVNGDIVLEFPLNEALAFHRKHKALATLLLFPQPNPPKYFPIRVTVDGEFLNFKGVSKSGEARSDTYVFTGVHIIEPDIFRYIPEGDFFEINDQVYPQAIKNGAKILGFPVEGYWNDVGDPARYLEAQKDLLLRNPGDTGAGCSYSVCVNPTAEVDGTARFGPFASIGAHSRVESGATVENSILWEDVCIKSGASVTNCILGSGVSVEGEVKDMIITRNGQTRISGSADL